METHVIPEFKRLLVAVDGSDNAARAAKVAVTLAEKFGAELIVCHVIVTPAYSYTRMGAPGPTPLSEYFALAHEDSKRFIGEILSMAEAEGVKAHELVIDNVFSVVEAIVKHAADGNVDMIIVGSRGLSGFKKMLLGSVSSGLVNHAHCSVLLVR